MPLEFKLPELGENVKQGTVAKILQPTGASVRAGQPLLEMETDKAVVEIPAPSDGVIVEWRVKEGQTVKVGATLLVLKESSVAPSEAITSVEKSAAASPPASSSPASAKTPRLQVLERPTPAPTQDVRVSPQASIPTVQVAPAAAHTATTSPDSTGVLAGAASLPKRTGPVLAAPSVRRLARELGVDLALVPSADPSGRITAQDVYAYVQRQQGLAATSAVASSAAPAPTAEYGSPTVVAESDRWGNVSYEPFSNVRRKTAEHMAHSWSTIPHVTHADKADITALEALRQRTAKRVEAQGTRLTVTVFLLKVIAEALRRFPKFNASVDIEHQRTVFKHYYHIGVAVDTPNGLLVPVVRDVDKKSIIDLAKEVAELAEKARNRRLGLEEMQGGTFTISNLGGLGGTHFTPIINAPEVAILGVSRAAYEPVFLQGQFVPRLMLPLALSYDHRLIDGAEAARFLRWVCETLEQPWALWLEA